MNRFSLQAPAKLNLSLRVVGKRADGFHEIDTVMVKLPALADTLEFTAAQEFSFTCTAPDVPADDRNLVVKAAMAYDAVAGVTSRCAIHLVKTIPHGAGLAGGSSDAAQTLLGLNRLHDFKLGASTLHEIAASLGSDIPFFLISGAARCTGRGEIIEAIPSPPALPIVLLKPAFGVETPGAYRRWRDSQEIPGIRYAEQALPEITLVNDLERPVFEKHRFLAELKEWLLNREETRAALMSGSGSTVFAILKPTADAAAVATSARQELDPGLWNWVGFTEGAPDAQSSSLV
jgi:4-diphosphocytidyl-2-C-methyl-D-erythritol kinase